MENIFITGSNGMLADAVINTFAKSKNINILRSDISASERADINLDVSDEDIIQKIEKLKPDFIFHFAAETDVDLCEKEPEHAFQVNKKGTENIVSACVKTGSKLVFISSGAVFNGEKKEPYIETDKPDPANVYGKTKLEAERFIQRELAEHYIFRAGWMVGGREKDKKFVYKIVGQLLDEKKEVKAVSDKFGSPTFTWDFARNMMNVMEKAPYGLYHMANKGTASRYDMAVKIVEFMGLEGKVKVIPVSSDEFPLPAPRGRSEMLGNAKLEELGLNDMPFWEESLRRYIEAWSIGHGAWGHNG